MSGEVATPAPGAQASRGFRGVTNEEMTTLRELMTTQSKRLRKAMARGGVELHVDVKTYALVLGMADAALRIYESVESAAKTDGGT